MIEVKDANTLGLSERMILMNSVSYVGQYLRINEIEPLIDMFNTCTNKGNTIAKVCLQAITKIVSNEAVNSYELLELAFTLHGIESQDIFEVIFKENPTLN